MKTYKYIFKSDLKISRELTEFLDAMEREDIMHLADFEAEFAFLEQITNDMERDEDDAEAIAANKRLMTEIKVIIDWMNEVKITTVLMVEKPENFEK